MKLNPTEKLILVNVLSDRDRYLAYQPGRYWWQRNEEALYRQEQAKEGIVPLRTSEWAGHRIAGSEAVAFHRAYARLERLRLIQRWDYSEDAHRATHLQLLPAGERTARQLLREHKPE